MTGIEGTVEKNFEGLLDSANCRIYRASEFGEDYDWAATRKLLKETFSRLPAPLQEKYKKVYEATSEIIEEFH